MKFFVGALAVVAVAFAVVVVALSGNGSSSPSATSSQHGSGDDPPITPSSAACPDAISWDRAADYTGESVTLRGPVVSATFRRQLNGKPTFLNIGRPFGDPTRLIVVIWGRNRSKFPTAPERTYDGESITVTGRVSSFRGVPQIEVRTPSDIERCDA